MRKRNGAWGLVAFLLILGYASCGVDLWNQRELAATAPPAEGYEYVGIVHCHSEYSHDATSPVDRIISAASSAGVDFVFLTDHNNVDALLDGHEGWHDDVLFLVGQETSTPFGHYVVLDCPEALPGRPFDDFVSRLVSDSLAGLVAHPYHPKTPWTEWEGDYITGMEIINLDSQWRSAPVFDVLRGGFLGTFSLPALSSMANRPSMALAKVDSLGGLRHTMLSAGTDSHGSIAIWKDIYLNLPAEAELFSLVRNHLVLSQPLSSRAEEARAQVVEAIENGSLFVGYDCYADSRGFRFYITSGGKSAGMGEEIELSGGAGLAYSLPDGAFGSVTRIIRDGAVIHQSTSKEDEFRLDRPGMYRLECYQTRRTLPFFAKELRPWIYSNAIWLKS
jgi:hypothetical protein